MPFAFETTPLEGLVIVRPRRFDDDRGWFQEAFKASDFETAGLPGQFVQDNLSKSSAGTLRGIHFQKGASAQGKLVQVLAGAVWDVAVDLRPDSKTRGRWFGIELTAEDPTMFYIPPGFGHGFVSLCDGTLFSYKCTRQYDKASEGGIVWDDPTLAIAWPLKEVLVSEKDRALPRWNEASL